MFSGPGVCGKRITAKPLKARAPRAKKTAVEKTIRKAPIESLSLFDDKGEENVG